MDREALVIIGAAFFVLGLVLIFVWNPMTPVIERISDRIYYWTIRRTTPAKDRGPHPADPLKERAAQSSR